MNKTVVISIGNSDDKLTQKRWSEFIDDVVWSIARYGLTIHFNGYSVPTASWQNACWIIQVPEEHIHQIGFELSRIADKYQQDSIALLIGETEFVSGPAKS